MPPGIDGGYDKPIITEFSTQHLYPYIVEKSPFFVFIVNPAGIITYCNSHSQMLLGYSQPELLGKLVKTIIHPDYTTRILKILATLRTSGGNFKEQGLFLKKGGAKIPVILDAYAFRLQGQRYAWSVFQLESSGREHSDQLSPGTEKHEHPAARQSTSAAELENKRHLARELLEQKKLLKEKEVLLQEIYHRVKNNLQVISSMVGLQIMRLEDDQYKSAFEDIKNRIYTMSLLHQLLYQSGDLSRLDMKKYVQELCQYLGQACNTGVYPVSFHIQIEEVFLDLEQAVPCSLILHELVSNSLKHAFPAERKGNISIKMVKEKRCNLEIGDDGIGLPREITPENSSSLGIVLLVAFIDQLEGSLQIKRENGTKFIISFPVYNREGLPVG